MRTNSSLLNFGRIASLVLAVVSLAGSTFATTEKLVYTFPGSPDGALPVGGLVADAAGNLYGTTYDGGSGNTCCGIVFELSPPSTAGGAWTETVLHTFGSNEGNFPTGTLVFDKAGNLYGTTSEVAGRFHSGSIFELSPPALPGGAWTETVLATGSGLAGKLVIDVHGNLYGSSSYGGSNRCTLYGCGTVFELVAPAIVDGAWTKKVLYDFGAVNDGVYPGPDLLLRDGILYGTTTMGGLFNAGTVFQLKAKPGLWTETILYTFPGNGSSNPQGSDPYGGLIADSAGNLYGTTVKGGENCWCGTVYELSPPPVAGNPWMEKTLYAFTNSGDGDSPSAALWRDNLGNLYGTAGGGKTSQSTQGLVFKLKPPMVSGGTWTLVVLHYFRGGASDGAHPFSALTWLHGLLYGTTENGGQNITPDIKAGTVFSVVP